MTSHDRLRTRILTPWRLLGWGAAVALLSLPAIGMQFSSEVHWTLSDFVIAGLLIGGTGLALEVAVMMSSTIAYRIAAGLALGASLMMVWINLAVGIIGNEDNPLNLVYAGILAVGLIGAVLARLEPRGMALAMIAMACCQVLVGALSLYWAPATGLINLFFLAIWLLSAWLFNDAANAADATAHQ